MDGPAGDRTEPSGTAVDDAEPGVENRELLSHLALFRDRP